MVNEEKEILRFLIEHKEQKFSINQITKARKINYKSAYQNINKLEKRGVILAEKLGNITLCSFNYKFDPLVFNVEWERSEDIQKNKIIKSISRDLKEVEVPFFTALLFGSYAKGTQNKNSDIDILIIIDDMKDFENIRLTMSILPFNIHIVNVTSNEFLSMVKSKEFSVIEEVKKNNIILFGIENYYNLIKNVRY
ncbi:MAG: nucleotidyltransferase domain-containing protein [Candidatus Woesearchaeota archaeon]